MFVIEQGGNNSSAENVVLTWSPIEYVLVADLLNRRPCKDGQEESMSCGLRGGGGGIKAAPAHCWSVVLELPEAAISSLLLLLPKLQTTTAFIPSSYSSSYRVRIKMGTKHT